MDDSVYRNFKVVFKLDNFYYPRFVFEHHTILHLTTSPPFPFYHYTISPLHLTTTTAKRGRTLSPSSTTIILNCSTFPIIFVSMTSMHLSKFKFVIIFILLLLFFCFCCSYFVAFRVFVEFIYFILYKHATPLEPTTPTRTHHLHSKPSTLIPSTHHYQYLSSVKTLVASVE